VRKGPLHAADLRHGRAAGGAGAGVLAGGLLAGGGIGGHQLRIILHAQRRQVELLLLVC